MASKCRVSVSLPDHDFSALMAFAKKHDVSMSWLSRQAIHEFLVRYQEEGLQLPLNLKRAVKIKQ